MNYADNVFVGFNFLTKLPRQNKLRREFKNKVFKSNASLEHSQHHQNILTSFLEYSQHILTIMYKSWRIYHITVDHGEYITLQSLTIVNNRSQSFTFVTIAYNLQARRGAALAPCHLQVLAPAVSIVGNR